MLKTNLETLKQQDIYSLLLFSLYKMTSIPEYSSISELAYVLDRENLVNLCEFFGGQTIKIPTISELESLVYSLLLYQYTKIDKMDYNNAIKLIGHKPSDLRKVKSEYKSLCEILDNYTFTPRDNIGSRKGKL